MSNEDQESRLLDTENEAQSTARSVQNPSNTNKKAKDEPVECFSPNSPVSDQNDCESICSSSYVKIYKGDSVQNKSALNQEDLKPIDTLTCQSDKESNLLSSFVNITAFDAATRRKSNSGDTATLTSCSKRKKLEWEDKEDDCENTWEKEKLLEGKEPSVEIALADSNSCTKDQQYLSDTSSLTGQNYDSDFSSSFVHINALTHRRSKSPNEYDAVSNSSSFTCFDESTCSFIKVQKKAESSGQSITQQFVNEYSIKHLADVEETSLGTITGTLKKFTFERSSSSRSSSSRSSTSLNKKFATCDIGASSDNKKSSSGSTIPSTDDKYKHSLGGLIHKSHIKSQHEVEDGEQDCSASAVEYIVEVTNVSRDEACVALYTSKDDINEAIMQILSKREREDSIKKNVEVTALPPPHSRHPSNAAGMHEPPPPKVSVHMGMPPSNSQPNPQQYSQQHPNPVQSIGRSKPSFLPTSLDEDWQSDKDITHRQQMIDKIIQLLLQQQNRKTGTKKI